jgi:chorismate mutase/prephenate dehydratase
MNEIKDKQILEVRKKIDIVDRDLLSKLEERFKLANQISKIKIEKNLPLRDKERESEVIRSKSKLTNLPEYFVARLFRLIIEESVRQQDE